MQARICHAGKKNLRHSPNTTSWRTRLQYLADAATQKSGPGKPGPLGGIVLRRDFTAPYSVLRNWLALAGARTLPAKMVEAST
ncbi:hypothetical protein HNQ64_001181 [Prosthecobacter dejongeii]|uniref:Uncharacterized protein n=1 Tax=Prosthecobacter dejongeii TaxID=48465 RepID=A0A7W7YIX0_9BACT|nr:hypothetical protein [Prosthecobacter dejongeii]